MTSTKLQARYTSLDALYEAVKSGALDGIEDWTDLPVYGGEGPRDTSEVWSWDASRLMVGTCKDDMGLVERSQRPERCQCGKVMESGEYCEAVAPASEMVDVLYVPAYQRGTARAAGSSRGVEHEARVYRHCVPFVVGEWCRTADGEYAAPEAD